MFGHLMPKLEIENGGFRVCFFCVCVKWEIIGFQYLPGSYPNSIYQSASFTFGKLGIQQHPSHDKGGDFVLSNHYRKNIYYN